MGLGWRVGLGALCASLLISTSVFAQAPTQGAAGKLFENALEEINARNWPKAWELLSAAYKLDPRPEYAVNLGIVELKLERPRDAAEHLSFFLREATNASPGDRQRAEKKLTEAKSKIGTVLVRVEPTSAEVRLDGRPVGTSPLAGPLYVEPGRRTFEARKEGLPSESQGVEVEAGAESVVELKLVPPAVEHGTSEPPPPLPPKTGERSKGLIYAGASVSAALAAVGVVGVAGWHVKYAEAEDALHQCSSDCKNKFDDAEKTRVAFGYTSLFTFIGAGVVGGATAIYALTGGKSDKSTTPKTGLVVAPGGGGLVITGSW
jgi:hypothetical protein